MAFHFRVTGGGKIFSALLYMPTLWEGTLFSGSPCKFLLSELLVQDNHSGGNYFLIYEINEMLN